jgi:transposase
MELSTAHVVSDTGSATGLTEVESLRAENKVLRVKVDELKTIYLDMLQKFRLLERGILFQGRERLPVDESLTLPLLSLMMNGGAEASVAAPATVEAPAAPAVPPPTQSRAKPTGRQVLPEKLPRVDLVVVPPEVEAKGRDQFDIIGQEISETIERRPASLVVVRVVRPKFVAKDRDRLAETKVHIGATPDLPIPGGLPGPALLADTVVRRFEDALPLHRLERVYGRDGLSLARSTICGWHMALADLFESLIDAMWKDARKAPYLCVDATGVLVQDIRKCRRAHFFVVIDPGRHVLFGYTPKHNMKAVDDLLADFSGVLVADAATVYDHLVKSGQVTKADCWAHARRYFFKALGSDPARARYVIELIGKLFDVERPLKTVTPEKRLEVRREHSLPVATTIFDWCRTVLPSTVEHSPIAKACQYVLNQQATLSTCFQDGRIPIHNNISEGELRREAIGRKNWLFLGSDDGGVVNARLVTLIASARHHGIDPAEYLRDLLCLLPTWPARDVLDLAPVNWAATIARPEVQARLARNPFRRASLGESLDHPPDE